VSVGYDQTWMDQNSSWWAKANRAKEHIDSLRRQVNEGVRDASFLHVATGSDQANRIETLPTCDPDELDEL
jgi:hypothetical protein